MSSSSATKSSINNSPQENSICFFKAWAKHLQVISISMFSIVSYTCFESNDYPKFTASCFSCFDIKGVDFYIGLDKRGIYF